MAKKKRADGGKVSTSDKEWDGRDGDTEGDRDVTEAYNARGSHVEREARGEMAEKRGGEVTKKRFERKEKKRGGETMAMEGEAAKKRLDRPGRKRGGGVGADSAPLTTASKTRDRVGGREDARSGG